VHGAKQPASAQRSTVWRPGASGGQTDQLRLTFVADDSENQARRHLSEQYFTWSQSRAHFLRHSKSSPQVTHILGENPFFTCAFRTTRKEYPSQCDCRQRTRRAVPPLCSALASNASSVSASASVHVGSNSVGPRPDNLIRVVRARSGRQRKNCGGVTARCWVGNGGATSSGSDPARGNAPVQYSAVSRDCLQDVTRF